jgi:hypothetical protein
VFSAETDLLFNFMWLPDEDDKQAAVANYELAEGRPEPGDRILVDEGTLVVAKMGEGPEGGGPEPLWITTTKRVQFNHSFTNAQLALMMCALGYADAAAELLACCALHGQNPGVGHGGTDFPGVSPPVPAPVPAPATAAGAPGPSAGAPGQAGAAAQTRPGGLVQDAVGIWGRAMREWAQAMERGAGGAGNNRGGGN